MNRYLYRIQPTRPGMFTDGPTDVESGLIKLHYKYLKGLTERGVALFVGRTTDADAFGIVVYEAASDEEAEAIMLADPAIAGAVMAVEWHPFRVVLHSEFDDCPAPDH